MRAMLTAAAILTTSLLLGFGVPTVLAQGEVLTDQCDDPAAMQERARAEWQQAIKARLDFFKQAGLTEQDLRAMLRAKRQRHRLVEDLKRQAEELAIALETPEADGELIQSKVEAYVKARDETREQLKQIEQEVLEATNAKDRPKVLGTMLIMGAIDNGIISLCGIHSPVAGGVGNAVKPPHVGRAGALAPRRGARRPFGTRRAGN